MFFIKAGTKNFSIYWDLEYLVGSHPWCRSYFQAFVIISANVGFKNSSCVHIFFFYDLIKLFITKFISLIFLFTLQYGACYSCVSCHCFHFLVDSFGENSRPFL